MPDFTFTANEQRRLSKLSSWIDDVRAKLSEAEREKKRIRDRARMRFLRKAKEQTQ